MNEPAGSAAETPVRERFLGQGISFRHAAYVWFREVLVYSHFWRTILVSTALDPIIYLAAMGIGLGAFVGSIGGVPYLDFIAPGLVASAAMNGATFETTWNTWGRIHQDRIYESIMATPVNVEDVVVGEMMWATSRALLQSTIILLVLVVAGLIHSWMAIFIPVVAALVGLVFAICGLTYNSLIHHHDLMSFYFTLFITPLFLFSGIFFPLTRLPPAILWIAEVTPLYHGVIVIRALAEGTVNTGVGLHLLYLVAFVALFFWIPVRNLRKRLVT